MTVSLGALVSITRDNMNAVGSDQWSDATLIRWLGVAHWKEWGNLLNANNAYYMQQVSCTQDTAGQVAVSALTTGTGDSTKNFYRILTVAQPASAQAQIQFFYKEVRFKQYPNPQPNTSLPYVWYRFGSQLQILPVAAGQAMTVTVNYRPQRLDYLTAATTVAVDFPSGYEDLLPMTATAMALRKGGSEVQAAGLWDAMATEYRNEMLLDLSRQGTEPFIVGALDSPDDWGGVFILFMGLKLLPLILGSLAGVFV
jgi:hypothetical protein